VFGTDERCAGEALLNGGEDLHPLDGVDPQVGIQTHVQIEHFFRVTGLLADDGEQGGGDPGNGCCRCNRGSGDRNG